MARLNGMRAFEKKQPRSIEARMQTVIVGRQSLASGAVGSNIKRYGVSKIYVANFSALRYKIKGKPDMIPSRMLSRHER
jgi:short-subunit dehydrogenase